MQTTFKSRLDLTCCRLFHQCLVFFENHCLDTHGKPAQPLSCKVM